MPRLSKLWDIFDKSDPIGKKATCQLCSRRLSYATTISNLRSHLKKKHFKAFLSVEEEAQSQNESKIESDGEVNCTPSRKLSSESYSTGCDDNDNGRFPDVWTYFEKESPDRARCVICRETLDRSSASMVDHMRERHAKLPVDTDTMVYGQNSYTEVVYLEDEEPIKPVNSEKLNQKRKSSGRKPIVLEYHTTAPVKRKRSQETNSEDEIEFFAKYVTKLLKDVPKNTCIKLQSDIIQLIVTEKLKSSSKTTLDASTQIRDSSVILTAANATLLTVPSED